MTANRGERGSRGTSEDTALQVYWSSEGGLPEGGSNGCTEKNSLRIHFGGTAEKIGVQVVP